MPAVLLFRHPRDDGALLLSVAVIHRRASKRDSARDVIEGKVSLIEDIDLSSPHAAHLRIPQSMALIEVDAKFVPSSFDKLDQAWRKVLNDADSALALQRKVPILNGGLFEFLDRLVTPEDLKREQTRSSAGRHRRQANRAARGRLFGAAREPDAHPQRAVLWRRRPRGGPERRVWIQKPQVQATRPAEDF